MDGAAVVGDTGEIHPSPGDITVCMYCGHLMAFDRKLRFRQLTDAEMIEVAGDERIIAVSKARKAIFHDHT